MVVVSIVVFALVRLSGDPIQIMAPPEASQADIAAMRAYLGLDRPWTVQYGRFITRALQGDEPPVLHRPRSIRSEEHTSELQSRLHLVCRLLPDIKNDTSAGESVDV